MQNTSSGVGVSPAYFISRFGETFGVQDVIDALPDLVDLDATAVQLEVYHRARLDEWTKRARELTSHVAAFGLCPSQFVAHFPDRCQAAAAAISSS